MQSINQSINHEFNPFNQSPFAIETSDHWLLYRFIHLIKNHISHINPTSYLPCTLHTLNPRLAACIPRGLVIGESYSFPSSRPVFGRPWHFDFSLPALLTCPQVPNVHRLMSIPFLSVRLNLLESVSWPFSCRVTGRKTFIKLPALSSAGILHTI